MSFDPEAVTQAASGLTFVNYYDASVTPAYRDAILSAEHFLQSHFTNQVTITVSFELTSLGADTAASNQFSLTPVSYSTLTSALRSHATTADDHLAVNGLPFNDPSNGVGFSIPDAQARILGLAPQTNDLDVSVALNSKLAWTFGQDAVGALLHEITEGGFGRIASLGLQATRWQPLDLFRFTAQGVRDFTGGSDGVTTFFGLDGANVSSLPFHNAIAADGTDDGSDLGDWSDAVFGDAFGPGGPSAPGSVSATDLRVLDILGWNSTPFTPAADDFANSLGDSAHALGQLAPGGSATGALQAAGDRDWFRVQLQAGLTYTVTEAGHASGAGTLGDPFLRLHDGGGAVLASNDDIVDGTNPDSRISFAVTTSGTYYVEAGAFVDGYAGSYRVSIDAGVASAPAPTAGDDVLTASAGATDVHAGAGNDTVSGWSGDDFLTGDDGNDLINGGPAFDRTNGNAGNDTVHGNDGNDWVTGGRDNDVLTGDGGDDILNGNLGADTADGGAGADTVRGGQGDDVLSGGAGNDFVTGDLGNDTLSGGAGADTFRAFAGGGSDRISDFNATEGDRVRLDPGTAFTVSQVGADTVIDLGGGAQTVLVGVQLSSLPATWIFGA